MTTQEFSNGFDTLINAYNTTTGYGEDRNIINLNLDEYEKSLLLTQAQDLIVKELYSTPSYGVSFERTEKIRRQLEPLVIQYTATNGTVANLPDAKYIHTVYQLPDDCWFIVYEQIGWSTSEDCLNNRVVDVVPVTHDDYWRTRNNPFRGPNGKRALRLDNGDKSVEIVSANNINTYTIRYLKKPEPIILEDLVDVKIDDENKEQTCQLPTSLHYDILQRAVQLAIATRAKISDKD